MTITDNLELSGQAADVASAVAAHPFFKRLQATEHDAQAGTANAAADQLASGDGELDISGIAASLTRGHIPAADDTDLGDTNTDDADPAAAAGDDLEPPAATTPTAGTPEPTPAPTSFKFRDGDAEIELSEDQVRRLVGLDRWATSIPEQVARQFAAIEQQVAVAVPTDEYAAFQAWRAGTTGQQSGRGTQPSRDDEWVHDLDPQAAEAFARLQAETVALQQQNAALAQQAASARQPELANEVEQRIAVFDTAIADYAASTGLTPDQAGELLEVAVAAGIIPTLVESQRHYSPSGMLVQDADLALVARQALDFGRLQRPGLAPAASPSPAPAPSAPPALSLVPPVPAAPTTPTPDPTAQKRARASSLAAAPSAATTPPGYDPATAAPQQQRNAIADHLRDLGIAR